MNDLRRAIIISIVILLGAITSTVRAQEHPVDPEALQAFQQLLDAYRARPALRVKSNVTIQVAQGDTTSDQPSAEAEILFAPGRQGIVKLNGFTCYLKDGQLTAVNETNEDSYFTMPDDGSPYYALLNCFVDMPFPHLAIAFGADGAADVSMQLHPRASWINPTKVEDIEVDGKAVRRLTFSSDLEKMVMEIDPASNLIRSAELTITGGNFVQPGNSLTYKYEYEYDEFDKPLGDDAFAFEPGPRQRVDSMLALMPKPQAPGRGAGALVGQPAPELILATADGKAVDLIDYVGQVVVLDFWATWCGPCVRALPMLHDVARWARDEQLPVKFITVNVWESRDPQNDSPEARLKAVNAFWEKHGFTLPIAMDYTDETAAAYGIQGIPATFIIRSDGVVHAQHSGASDNYAEMLKQDIREALDALEQQPAE